MENIPEINPMTILAIANQKGGVGKTSICFHLAGSFAELGKKVLVIDLDQQGNLSSIFLDNIYTLEHTIADLFFNEEFSIKKALVETDIPNIHLIPSNLDLSNIDIQLAADPEAQYLLTEKIQPIRDQYDLVLIDCPPSLGLATRSGLVAADGVLIPLEAAEWAARGSTHLKAAMAKIRKRANPRLKLLGYVINRFDGRRKLEQDYLSTLQEVHQGKVFKAVIKDSVKYSQSISERRKPITMYMPTSEYAEAIRLLTQEIIAYGQNR